MTETTSEPFLPTIVTNEDENDANTSSAAPTQNTISTTIDPLKVLPLEHLNNSKTESPRDINVTIEANSQETSSTSITTESSSTTAAAKAEESVEVSTESEPATTTSKSNSSTMRLDEIENKMESKNVDRVSSGDNNSTQSTTKTQVAAETSTQSTFVSSSSATPSQQKENIDITTTTTTSVDKSSKIEFSNNMQTTTKAISENQDTKIDEVKAVVTLTPDEDEIKVTTTTMTMELSDGTQSPVAATPIAKEGRAIDLSTVQVKPIISNNDTTNTNSTINNNKEQSTESMLEAIKLSTTTTERNQSNDNKNEQIPISVDDDIVESTTIHNQREESTVDSVTHNNNEHFDDEHSSRSHLDTERQQDIISDDICTKSGILYKVRFVFYVLLYHVDARQVKYTWGTFIRKVNGLNLHKINYNIIEMG